MNQFLRIVGLAALIAGIPSIAKATSLVPMTVEQMTDASDLIVRGVVEDVRLEVAINGHINTVAEVRVTEAIKGGVDVGDYVSVVSPGGGSPELGMMDVPGVARFSVDEDTLLFLWSRPDLETYGTVGLAMGKYTVKQNPTDGSKMIVRFTTSYRDTYDARFIPNPPSAERVSLDTMQDRVKARIDLGWDGKAIPGVTVEHLRQINRVQPGVK